MPDKSFIEFFITSAKHQQTLN